MNPIPTTPGVDLPPQTHFNYLAGYIVGKWAMGAISGLCPGLDRGLDRS